MINIKKVTVHYILIMLGTLDSLEVLQSEPVDYSGFQPSAVMPSLKPAPQEQLRAGKTSETAENVPGTCTDCGQQFCRVSNVCDKY